MIFKSTTVALLVLVTGICLASAIDTSTVEDNLSVVTIATSEKSSTANIDTSAQIWETGTHREMLIFNLAETTNVETVTRIITINNLTDSLQSYTVSNEFSDVKTSDGNFEFTYPSIINIPANNAVSFPVMVTVGDSDFAALELSANSGLNITNNDTSVNGYFVFNGDDESANSLKMAFQLLPKAN